jgi:hypothetical protein
MYHNLSLKEDANPKGKSYETRSGKKLLWPFAEATSSGSDVIFPTDSKQTGEKVADADKSNLGESITTSPKKATNKVKRNGYERE